MAPKKRDRKADAEPGAKRSRTRARHAMEEATGQIVASQDVVVALACALDKSTAAMPPIRKVILEGEQVASVFDAMKAFRGPSCNPYEECRRLSERYPEVLTNCENFKFSGKGQRETPVADAKTLVQIILLLPGEQAAKVRMEASRVFVGFLGGNVALVDEILENRQMQELLQRENPEHWARFFGEHVEAAASSAGHARVQQDLVQKACEMVLPAVTRALAEAFSQKIDDMVQEWQRQAMQQVDATLQDSSKL